MKMTLPTEYRCQLARAVSSALIDAFRNSSDSEPQMVANLVYQLPWHVNRVEFDSKTSIKSGGVFVHSRPLVSCSSFPEPTPKSVEIGDLLLLRTLVVNGEIKEKRALLLQAKKINRIPSMPDNKNQWHLYERWPKFKYASKSGGLNKKPRHIKEMDMYDSAKFLLIGLKSTDNLNPRCFATPKCYYWMYDWFHDLSRIDNIFVAQPTATELSNYRYFADELVEFLSGNAGKIFTKPNPRTRGWNRVIQDIITETAKAKSVYAARAASKSTSARQSTASSRGTGVLFLSSTQDSGFFQVAGSSNITADNPNEPPRVPEEWSLDDDYGGISIVEFVVEQNRG